MRTAPQGVHHSGLGPDTSIPTLVWGGSNEPFQYGLNQPPQKKFLDAVDKVVAQKATLQILLLNPNSFGAKQRALDRGLLQPEQYIDGMKSTLAFLHKISSENNPAPKSGDTQTNQPIIAVRLYNTLPMMAVYSCSDYVYAGFFPHNKACDEGTILKIFRYSEFGDYVRQQFVDLWEAQNTIDLDTFLKMQLVEERIKDLRADNVLYYLPRNKRNENILTTDCPTHIAADKAIVVFVLDEEFNSNKKVILRSRIANALNQNSQLPKIATLTPQTIAAYISGRLKGGEYDEVAKKFENRYGTKFLRDTHKIYELDSVASDIRDCGWSYCSHDSVHTKLKDDRDFVNSWDKLEDDKYLDELKNENGLPKFGIRRQRRIAKFLIPNIHEDDMQWLPKDVLFNQGNANHLFAHKVRKFSAMETKQANNSNLKAFIIRNLRLMLANSPDAEHLTWRVIVHQFRVLPTIVPESQPESDDGFQQTIGGSPSPEGFHQDGHDYISMHLIKLNNVVGGKSQIKQTYGGQYIETPLETPFDSVFLNDRRVFHCTSVVTPVSQPREFLRHVSEVSSDAIKNAEDLQQIQIQASQTQIDTQYSYKPPQKRDIFYRDMLIIDYEKMSPPV